MIPANLDITVYRGDDYVLVFRMKDSVSNTYTDLTSRSGRAQVRASAENATVIATFAVTVLDQANPATKGGVQITLTPTITAALPLTGGVWDVELADVPRSWVRTPLAGAVIVLPEVTR